MAKNNKVLDLNDQPKALNNLMIICTNYALIVIHTFVTTFLNILLLNVIISSELIYSLSVIAVSFLPVLILSDSHCYLSVL